MTAPLPADTWGPLALPWRVIAHGDIVLGHAGPLLVADVQAGPTVALYGAGQPWTGPVDPNQYVNVLVPLAEREAIRTLRESGLTNGDLVSRVA